MWSGPRVQVGDCDNLLAGICVESIPGISTALRYESTEVSVHITSVSKVDKETFSHTVDPPIVG